MELKKLILAVAGGLLFLVGFLYVNSWKVVKPKDGHFTVRMPGIAKEEKQSVSTTAGPVDTYLWESQSGGVEYMAGYVTFPGGLLDQQDQNDLFNNMRDGAMRTINGKVKTEYSMTLGNLPGREITCVGSHEGETRAAVIRIYLVSDKARVYMVGAATVPGAEKKKEFDRFFESFSVLPD